MYGILCKDGMPPRLKAVIPVRYWCSAARLACAQLVKTKNW